MVWRVSPAHKRLQTRMEHMRRFRRQHEQLRTVIVRVLRPTLLSVIPTRQIDQQSQHPSTPDQQETGDMKPEVLGLEAADANAIEVSCSRDWYGAVFDTHLLTCGGKCK